jgi:hypothetical protein
MYIITVRRITSGELLKQRKGLRIAAGYGSSPTTSSQFRLTTPAKALFSVPGPNEVVHTVWRVAGRAKAEALGAALDALDTLYIADGHHRAAAAPQVALQQRTAGAPLASHELFLAVAFPHVEMRILPYNRVVADLGAGCHRTRCSRRSARASGSTRARRRCSPRSRRRSACSSPIAGTA